jgi:ankyrin repeat protein
MVTVLKVKPMPGKRGQLEGLVAAIERRDSKAVRAIIRQSPGLIAYRGHGDRKLIHIAYNSGSMEVLRVLLKSGVELDARDSIGNTVLHSACINGDIRLVKTLLSLGASVNNRNSVGETPLSAACAWGHSQVVELLLAQGANPNTRDRGGGTPLDWAMTRQWERSTRRKRIVRLLRLHGARA